MKITHAFFDFDGVFTNNQVYCFDDGREAVKCFRGDGIGLQMLKDSGVDVCIVSTETNPIVKHRATKLGVPVAFGCDNKLVFIKSYLKGKPENLSKAVFIGNDINDLEAMEACQYALAPLDACWDITSLVRQYDRGKGLVLNAKGGQGAVREACEIIIRTNEKEAEE